MAGGVGLIMEDSVNADTRLLSPIVTLDIELFNLERLRLGAAGHGQAGGSEQGDGSEW